MKLFGQLIRTVVNVATLPADMLKDVGDYATGDSDAPSHTARKIEQIKDDAKEEV